MLSRDQALTRPTYCLGSFCLENKCEPLIFILAVKIAQPSAAKFYRADDISTFLNSVGLDYVLIFCCNHLLFTIGP